MNLSEKLVSACGKPVSYTHLDVYKRQFCNCSGRPSFCPAKPNKKRLRFLRCENWLENPLTSKLDMNFLPVPALF